MSVYCQETEMLPGESLESRPSSLRKAGGRGGGGADWAVRTLKPRLQGVRRDRELLLLRDRLGRLPFLRSDNETHVEAARFYRKARARGGVVPAADALIAATAVTHGVSLLTADVRHPRALARVSKLRLAN